MGGPGCFGLVPTPLLEHSLPYASPAAAEAARERARRATAKKKDDPEYRAHKAARSREWRRANPERVREHNSRPYEGRSPSARRRRTIELHGITVEQFGELLDAQDGRCALCRRESSKPLHIDHDHACCPNTKGCGACVRGLLCMTCNTGGGAAWDDIAFLRLRIEYLTNWPARSVLTLNSPQLKESTWPPPPST